MDEITHEQALHWDTLFMLLSLDSITLFLPDMKFPEIDIVRLQKAIRSFQKSKNKKSYISDSPDPISKINTIFEKIVKELGQGPVLKLSEWGKHIPQPGAESDQFAFLWKSILRVLVQSDDTGYQKVPLELPKKTINHIVINVNITNSDDNKLYNMVKQVKGSSLSKWDKDIFYRYGQNFDGSPMDWVLDIIEYFRFVEVWEKIIKSISESDKKVLLTWGKKQGAAMNMPDELMDNLW